MPTALPMLLTPLLKTGIIANCEDYIPTHTRDVFAAYIYSQYGALLHNGKDLGSEPIFHNIFIITERWGWCLLDLGNTFGLVPINDQKPVNDQKPELDQFSGNEECH
jgi:hypothetical protein